MRLVRFLSVLSVLIVTLAANAELNSPSIEVNGTATVSIIPDRITIEIGLEEYYKPGPLSRRACIADIEKSVRRTLHSSGVEDSLVIVSDMGNWINRETDADFLMAKRLSVTLTSMDQLDRIAADLDRKGITSFRIVAIDSSEMERYNREGLRAAMEAAYEKAEFMVSGIGMCISVPWEIVETTSGYMGGAPFSNVAFDGGSGIKGLRSIERTYSVRIRYLISYPQ